MRLAPRHCGGGRGRVFKVYQVCWDKFEGSREGVHGMHHSFQHVGLITAVMRLGTPGESGQAATDTREGWQGNTNGMAQGLVTGIGIYQNMVSSCIIQYNQRCEDISQLALVSGNTRCSTFNSTH